ncbi:MAG TPA: M48 family metalloprotease [Euzebyales bacterium]
MTVALALMVLGMSAPYLLRRFGGRTPAAAIVAGHVASPVLVWLCVVSVTVDAVGAAHRPAAWAELVPGVAGGYGPPAGYAMTAVLLLMIGRSASAWYRTAATVRAARQRYLAMSSVAAPGVAFAPIGSVACTVGLFRPMVFVNPERYTRLAPDEQAAVLAHERGHVRGRHGLIDLLMRTVTAGLRPLPGADLGRREVRRHLEALADDRASGLTSRRTVATAIVAAAASPPSGALGAAGWSTWRVERLLAPSPVPRPLLLPVVGLVALSLVALVQTVGHLVKGAHLFPVAFPVL